MKIYPYQTPEGIIELVEKSEYAKLLELTESLGRTAQNYHRQSLASEDRATKNLREVERLQAEVRTLELALHDAHNRLEQQLQDAVKRMEEVKVDDLCSMFISGHTLGQMAEAARTRLIQAAKGEQP